MVTATLVALLAAAPDYGDPPNGCGKERQAVKTLADVATAPSHFDSFSGVSVQTLRDMPAPHWDQNAPRSKLESVVYEARGWIIGAKLEADSDIHIVFGDEQDPSKTMVVEIPHPACMDGASAKAKAYVADARTKFLSIMRVGASYKKLARPRLATVLGVFFEDKLHGQTGVAPNGAELHPVLAIQFERGTR